MTEKSRESGCDLEPSETNTDPEEHGAREVASGARPEQENPVPTEVDANTVAFPPGTEASPIGSALETHLVPKRPSPVPASDVSTANAQSPSAGDDTVDIGPIARFAECANLGGTGSEAALATDGDQSSASDANGDDGDERPTRSYGLAAPNSETPALTAPVTSDAEPPSGDVDSDPIDASTLMDEPPLDEEGEAHSPIADRSVPNDRVRLLTADDTAAALRFLRSRSLDADTAAGSEDRPREPSAEATSGVLRDTNERLDVRGTETTPTDASVQSEPVVAASDAPQCSADDDVQKREANATGSASPVAPPPRAPKTTLPPLEAASRARGKNRSFAWIGVAAATTLLTAWWFVSPLHAPPAGSGTEPPAGTGRLDSPRPPEPERANPARASVEAQPAAYGVPGASATPSIAAGSNDAGPPDAGTAWLRAASRAMAPEPPPISNAVGPSTAADEATGTPSETDKEVVRAALRESALAAGRCRIQGDPSGWTRITITFESSGQVSFGKILKEPFKDTHTAECIEGRMRKITVPPFDGGPWTLVYPIEVF